MNTIAFRHLCFEDAGIIEELVALECIDVPSASDKQLVSGEQADLLVVLGGPIGVNDAADYPFLNRELDIIRTRLEARRPTLGICLGAQLIAAAAGGHVYAGPVKEIGWGPLERTEAGARGVLSALQPDIQVLHWHGDSFTLPDAATRLAGNAHYENQAFSLGSALGLQFHLEVRAEQLERWYVGHALEISTTNGVSVSQLRKDAQVHASRTAEAGKRVIAGWLDTL